MKPRIGIFSLTSCEGCSLAVLELEDKLLDILGAVDIVNFREGMTERAWELDVAFVDGAVSTPEDEREVTHIRNCCTTLVAIGACACLGGVNTLKNTHEEANYRRRVYGDQACWFPTIQARPLSAVVKVDFELPGCPMVKEEFLRLVQCVLNGKKFRLPDDPVCVECKKLGTLCCYSRGDVCMGPLTRSGCNAICPACGSVCEGCRGLLGAEVLASAREVFPTRYGVSIDSVLDRLRLYGAYQGDGAGGIAGGIAGGAKAVVACVRAGSEKEGSSS